MLMSKDREKVEQYIDKLTASISDNIQSNIRSGMGSREVIDSAICLTVNKLTPESKMILSSVYNMLAEKTLAGPLYQDIKNKAAFYEKDILRNLTANFSYEVPDHIDYEETRNLINKWTASGAIVVAGGVVSIAIQNVIPVAVAVVLAGIMLFLIQDTAAGNKQDVSALTAEYLKDVKQSLMAWIGEIEKSYDAEVKALEEELS